MLRVVLLSVIMLIVIFFTYTERVYVDCHILIVTCSSVMLSVIFSLLYGA